MSQCTFFGRDQTRRAAVLLASVLWFTPALTSATEWSGERKVELGFSWAQAIVGNAFIVDAPGNLPRGFVVGPEEPVRPHSFFLGTDRWALGERRQFVSDVIFLTLRVRLDKSTFDFFALFAGERIAGADRPMPFRIKAQGGKYFINYSRRFAYP